jgi:hypothetical protein
MIWWYQFEKGTICTISSTSLDIITTYNPLGSSHRKADSQFLYAPRNLNSPPISSSLLAAIRTAPWSVCPLPITWRRGRLTQEELAAMCVCAPAIAPYPSTTFAVHHSFQSAAGRKPKAELTCPSTCQWSHSPCWCVLLLDFSWLLFYHGLNFGRNSCQILCTGGIVVVRWKM